MNYEIYKTVRSKEDFLAEFCPQNIVDEIIKNRAYDKYMLRCEILNRDNFKCQNVNCKTPGSHLTIHHIKHKRNQGKDTVRNLITVCQICHKAFNAAKADLTFSKKDNVPAHVRGISFKLDMPEKGVNWKKVRAEMKQVRKNLKHGGVVYKESDWQTILNLMLWLAMPYDDDLQASGM